VTASIDTTLIGAGEGQPAGYLGRGAFAQRLAAAFLLPVVARQKNSVPSIICSRRWGSIDGTIGYWVRCRANASSLR
jgi:hypothetical protein